MSDEVIIPFDQKVNDNAVLLLAAAEELGLPADVVRTTEGAFVVSQEVYDKAFGPREEEKKVPVKKTAAKKTAAKKKAGD